MNTPRKPTFGAKFAKTPLQTAAPRPFRSEAQPNRVSSRFANNALATIQRTASTTTTTTTAALKPGTKSSTVLSLLSKRYLTFDQLAGTNKTRPHVYQPQPSSSQSQAPPQPKPLSQINQPISQLQPRTNLHSIPRPRPLQLHQQQPQTQLRSQTQPQQQQQQQQQLQPPQQQQHYDQPQQPHTQLRSQTQPQQQQQQQQQPQLQPQTQTQAQLEPQLQQQVVQPKTQNVTQQPQTQAVTQPRLHPIVMPVTQQKSRFNRNWYTVTVNGTSYKTLKKIGTGGFSVVYECFEPELSQTVAIKIIRMASADAHTRQNYSNELDLLKRLKDCEHVVKMYDSEFRPDINELLIVMEKGDADLSELMNSDFRRDGHIKGCIIDAYWVSMIEAVHEIHKHGVVHADLKPDNFVRVKNMIKLIDFGIADRLDPESTSVIKDHQIGTVNYMAPEALRNRALDASYQLIDIGKEYDKPVIKYNYKADIWSLGCVLYHMVYGQPPYYKYKDLISKVQAITRRDHNIDYPPISDDRLLNTLKSCLKYSPDERPTTDELLNDSYMKANRAPKFAR